MFCVSLFLVTVVTLVVQHAQAFSSQHRLLGPFCPPGTRLFVSPDDVFSQGGSDTGPFNQNKAVNPDTSSPPIKEEEAIEDSVPSEQDLPTDVKKNLPTAKASTSSPSSDAADMGMVPQEPDLEANADAVARRQQNSYDLGLGKNQPFGLDGEEDGTEGAPANATEHWMVPELVNEVTPADADGTVSAADAVSVNEGGRTGEFVSTRKMVARDQASEQLRGAIWDEGHYRDRDNGQKSNNPPASSEESATAEAASPNGIKRPNLFYPDIDMSIPLSVYNETYDAVWELLQWEAYQEAQREPLLVSFLYSTILNHKSLESSLAFLLANRLSSPMLISTQLQSFILEALQRSPEFRRAVRADMLAVRDRDPACTCLPDVFLYFKGFQSLQSHRVANWMWKNGKQVLSHFLQSQVSQIWQIDIHPNATVGEGIMLDHGTGIVVGETAMIGNNCSILHHVTLGGSGKKGVDRHPKIQDGVLLGAGATVLGNVVIGTGCQVGAGTLVITDLPAHSVAVGVPAKIIGSFVDVTEQPSNEMNQMIGDNMKIATFESFGI
ncbi:Serine acetyltransferase [Seminavis robusta]|uniref:serine O-acetyltransferase n=1 Tax=Seminavis robusta TaxID=568900 RepID=A0A9N8ER99_9STRA|nr:Serine acetyltransferase [Seminavis robusta]|eukprot:Sro1730_g294130.1 Serine acetyltransferase (552) ;mRNA; r:16097-18000